MMAILNRTQDLTMSGKRHGFQYRYSVGFDNDGRVDLYVTALGGNRLFHNEGNGRFVDVTAKAGTGGGTGGTTSSTPTMTDPYGGGGY